MRAASAAPHVAADSPVQPDGRRHVYCSPVTVSISSKCAALPMMMGGSAARTLPCCCSSSSPSPPAACCLSQGNTTAVITAGPDMVAETSLVAERRSSADPVACQRRCPRCFHLARSVGDTHAQQSTSKRRRMLHLSVKNPPGKPPTRITPRAASGCASVEPSAGIWPVACGASHGVVQLIARSKNGITDTQNGSSRAETGGSCLQAWAHGLFPAKSHTRGTSNWRTVPGSSFGDGSCCLLPSAF